MLGRTVNPFMTGSIPVLYPIRRIMIGYRICKECGAEFYDPNLKGKSLYCSSTCKVKSGNSKSSEYKKEWKANNRDKVLSAGSRYRSSNKDKIKDYYLRATYGISLAALRILLSKDNLCAICRVVITEYSVHIDHDHNCCPSKKTCGGCVRGLLCENCNKGLGHFKDNKDVLALALAYLSR